MHDRTPDPVLAFFKTNCKLVIPKNIFFNKLFRKLSEENRRLSCTVERELHEKKRLSMENEELHWKIRQSTDAVMSLSTIEGRWEKGRSCISSVGVVT